MKQLSHYVLCASFDNDVPIENILLFNVTLGSFEILALRQPWDIPMDQEWGTGITTRDFEAVERDYEILDHWWE